MANLVQLPKKGKPIVLNEVSVHPEETIERLIFENEILQDILILKRQVSTYSKDDRMDLVGLDRDNNIVIIELKDEMVQENVIPQVMRYANWVQTYPDAIRSIYLQQKEDFEAFTFDWNKFEIRILIIGPSFKPSVQKLINRMTYSTELIEFKKFEGKDSSYILLNTLPIEEAQKYSPVETAKEYDLAYYQKHRNPKSAVEFIALADKFESHLKKLGLDLKRYNNKYYVSFKYGYPIVFGIDWMGTKSFGLFFKVQRRVANKIVPNGFEMKWRSQWNDLIIKVENSEIPIQKFDKLILASYNNIVGK